MKRMRQRGVAALELAILLIPLLFICLGITEFGRAFYQYNMLLKSTRAAARYLSNQNTGVGQPEARCLAIHGNVNCANGKVLEGLSAAMVGVGYEQAGSVAIVRVTVSGYTFESFFTPFQVGFAPVSTAMRRP